jgi:IclR family transcriptional regulator, acetate operon repressor
MDVKTAGRTLELFELFAREGRPLSLTDIAKSLSAPVSSSFNLVRALEGRGYLYGAGGRRRVYPTRKIYEISKSIAAAEPWIEKLEPLLHALRNATRETVILGKMLDEQAIYLAVVEGPQSIRYSANSGDLKPLHSSAIGKALLTFLEATEREKKIGRLSMDRRTSSTITDRAKLMEDLRVSAERGFTITRGENVQDVMAIAIAVALGGQPYAIAVAGPMTRMEPCIENHHRRILGLKTEIQGLA